MDAFLGDPNLRRDLTDMCCAPMQFMWDNHLLAPRVEWEYAHDPGLALHMCFLKGFRVVRKYLFFGRDQALYECPFCRCQFVRPLGYRDLQHHIGEITTLTRLPQQHKELAAMGIPLRLLKEALIETKRRSKTWPPRD